MLHLKRFYAHNSLRNFSYLIYDDQNANAWAIDPYEGSVIKDFIKKEGLNLLGILNTHDHHDHVRGNSFLIDYFKAKVIEASSEINLSNSGTIEFIDSPGHTMDHKVFLLKSQGQSHLYSGDTFFNAGVGNCKNGGDVETLYLTTQKLLSVLDDNTFLHPGHDYIENNLRFALAINEQNHFAKEALYEAGQQDVDIRGLRTLKEEKKMNPFFQLDQLKLLAQFENLTEKEIFIHLRFKRDNW